MNVDIYESLKIIAPQEHTIMFRAIVKEENGIKWFSLGTTSLSFNEAKEKQTREKIDKLTKESNHICWYLDNEQYENEVQKFLKENPDVQLKVWEDFSEAEKSIIRLDLLPYETDNI